jgi:hypothetical protein
VTTGPGTSPSGDTPRPTRPPTFPPTTPAKTPPVDRMTIRGDVFDGVEGGCLLLRAQDGQAYLLLGGDRSVINSGGRLEVVGELQPGLVTTCQQGIPFSVISARRI